MKTKFSRSLMGGLVVWGLLSGPAAAEALKLSLQECIEQALRTNLGLQANRFAPKISLQELEQQKAQFGLKLGAEAGINQNVSPNNTSFISGGSVLEQLRQNYNLFLEQQLASGGSLRLALQNDVLNTNSTRVDVNPAFTPEFSLNLNHSLLRNTFNGARQISLRENSLKSAELTLKGQAIDTVAEVQDAYWSLVLFRQRLMVQERSLKILEDLLTMNQEKVKAGFMSRIDLLQTEANIAARRANLLDVRRNLENTQDRLKQLLNPGGKDQRLSWDSEVEPSDQPLFKAYAVSVDNSYNTALAKRPDFLSQTLTRDNIQIQAEIAEQNRLPQLNLQGSSGLQSLDGNLGGALGKLFGFQNYYWSLGLNFEMPVIGNSFEAIYAQAQLNLEQQETRLAESRQQILRDVRMASRNVEMTAQQVDATRLAKSLAEEQLKAQTEKLNLGLTTNFQVLQFQSDFESASLAEVNAVVENIRAINQLQRAEGTLLEAVGLQWENI